MLGAGGAPMHSFARAPLAALTPPAEASPADEPGAVVDRKEAKRAERLDGRTSLELRTVAGPAP